MSTDYTRRDFLRVSALGGATAAATEGVFELNSVSRSRVGATNHGTIAVWVTDENQRLASASPIEWHATSGQAPSGSVLLDPGKKFQTILGFGAAFTDAACYMFNQLPGEARSELFHKLFHPSEMGLNVCRTCMGSSDYSTKVYSYDEGEPDPELKLFSIEPDRAYILPMLREARKVNPDLFLFASPWSPPGWMKANGSMLGGSMRRKYMPSYANYFLKFLRGYESEGVPVQAITIQNEVDTDQDGRMPACIWPQEYEADFVRQDLGPLFEARAMQTKIWLIDHNYNLWGRAIAELETPGLRKYANAIAWHGYLGEPGWIDRVHDVFPDAAMYWTEGGPDIADPKYAKDWTQWSHTFTGILRHWCRSITAWNFALDEHGRPNLGPFSCGGLVTIHSQNKAISYSGQFWALAHYSRYVGRGAVRFDSQGATPDLSHAGFENLDGQRILVLTNSGAARTCELREGERAASVPLASNSVTTVRWK